MAPNLFSSGCSRKALSVFILLMLLPSGAGAMLAQPVMSAQSASDPAPQPASAAGVVTIPGDPIFNTVADYDDRVEVNNSEIIIDFYKGSAGYNTVREASTGETIIKNDQVALLYLDSKDWKQRGVPYELSYTVIDDRLCVVSRHYQDYLGTTFSVSYYIRAGEAVKFQIDLSLSASLASCDYRLVWSPSGIASKWEERVAGNTITYGQGIEDAFSLNWDDVYANFGNITSVSTATQAKGRKADIAFSIGKLAGGAAFSLDPAIVTSVGDHSLGFPQQGRMFYANGRFWVFYNSATTVIKYTSTVDGLAFTTPATYASTSAADHWAVYSNGTHVASVNRESSTNFNYTLSLCNSDGTLTYVGSGDITHTSSDKLRPSITIDSEGYVYIGCNLGTWGVNCQPYVYKNANRDGTWATVDGFPYRLTSSGDVKDWLVGVIPLNGSRIYATFTENDAGGFGKLYNGTAWQDVETIIIQTATQDPGINGIWDSSEDYMHTVWKNGTGVYYHNWTNPWGTATLISTDTLTEYGPGIIGYGFDNINFVFWATSTAIRYAIINHGVVGDVQTLQSEDGWSRVAVTPFVSNATSLQAAAAWVEDSYALNFHLFTALLPLSGGAGIASSNSTYGTDFDAVLTVNSPSGFAALTSATLAFMDNSTSEAEWVVPITITNNLGFGLDGLDVELYYDTHSLYILGKCFANCSDIWFTSDNSTALAFTMEASTNNTAATHFSVIPPDITDGASATIYMRYGNRSLTTSLASATSVAVFYDDFNDGSNSWSVGAGTWVEDSGYIMCNTASSDSYIYKSMTSIAQELDWRVEYRASTPTLGGAVRGSCLSVRVTYASGYEQVTSGNDVSLIRTQSHRGSEVTGLDSGSESSAWRTNTYSVDKSENSSILSLNGEVRMVSQFTNAAQRPTGGSATIAIYNTGWQHPAGAKVDYIYLYAVLPAQPTIAYGDEAEGRQHYAVTYHFANASCTALAGSAFTFVSVANASVNSTAYNITFTVKAAEAADGLCFLASGFVVASSSYFALDATDTIGISGAGASSYSLAVGCFTITSGYPLYGGTWSSTTEILTFIGNYSANVTNTCGYGYPNGVGPLVSPASILMSSGTLTITGIALNSTITVDYSYDYITWNITGDASDADYDDVSGELEITGCGNFTIDTSSGLPSGDFFITVNGNTWDQWSVADGVITVLNVPCPDAEIVVNFNLPGEEHHCSTCGGTGGDIPQGDNDGDGLPDASDPDDDNDGIPDAQDPRPFNWDPLPDTNENETQPPDDDDITQPTQEDFNSAVDNAFGFVPAEVRPVVVFTVMGLPVILILLLIVGGGATVKGATQSRTRRSGR